MRRHESSNAAAGARTRPGLYVGAILAASALLAGMGAFSVACSGDGLKKGLSGPTPSTPEELLAELKGQKERIDQATDRMLERIGQYNASRRPGERQIEFSEVFFDDLSAGQRDLLGKMVAEEKDLSYKSLLEQIIDERDRIRALQERILHLEQTLPDSFVLAKKGDSHHDLAMEYLTSSAGLDEARARKLLAEVDQTEGLLPGNKVWFFYDRDRDFFRTYVTRGEAGQTPLAVRLAMKRQLVSERDAAVARAAALEDQKARLETQVASLGSEVGDLTQRRSVLEAEVTGLRQSRDELEAEVAGLTEDLGYLENSLFYHAAAQTDLRDGKVLTWFRKEVRDVKGIEFDRALDLRNSNTITLQAYDYGLERIKEVRLLPSIYEEGRDYTIETSPDGSTASVVIGDPDLFRGKEVLLSLRGPRREEESHTTASR